MIAPLINLLKSNRKPPLCDQLLLGLALDLPYFNDHTKSLLNHLRVIKGILLLPSTPITQKEYTEEVNRIIEATSSGPSETTMAMVKTEALDPDVR